MQLISILNFLACWWCIIPCSHCSGSRWIQVHEDLSEYKLMWSASTRIRSEQECLHGAVEPGIAAVYSGEKKACYNFMCQLGPSGCRKCRNFRNGSLPLVWVKQLELQQVCWTTFQHRVDASVNFTRTWNEYLNEFGQGEDGNFWMGLEKLHQLTMNGGRRVRWEFSDWNGTWYWAENVNFAVAGASDKFRVQLGALDTSRSNVGQFPLDDSRSMHNQQFSTIDSDNDAGPVSCAINYQSAWWFQYCADFDPNRKYFVPPEATNLTANGYEWKGLFYIYTASQYPFTSGYSMRSFECMLG